MKKEHYIPETFINKALTLSEAMPYMKEFNDSIFVIKYGGSAMESPELAKQFAHDVVLLKQVGINPIIVHGGGPQIGKMLKQLNIESKFIDGLRVTNADTIGIVEMILSGSINKQIVANINEAGGSAIGLSGKDADLIKVKKIRKTKKSSDSNIEQILELGFVGEPEEIDPYIFDVLEDSDIIPVIAPLGIGKDGETYNINADTVAGAIAEAVSAKKLILLTDVPGVLAKDGDLITGLNINDAHKLIENGSIQGGMIPKIETCIHALRHDTESVHILDGRIPHVMLVEIFTNHGAGTKMVE